MFGRLQLIGKLCILRYRVEFGTDRSSGTEDNDEASLNPSAFAQLGTIRVELFAIKRRIKSVFVPIDTNLPGEIPISEKAKKAGSHAVK